MFNFLRKGQDPFQRESNALYHTAMTQARNPVFYEEMGVPDTMDGRFEMVCAHVGLLINRINRDDTEQFSFETRQQLSQALFDTMFTDMEESLRQIGIGDMGIPRRMKYMMQSLNGRVSKIAEPAFEQKRKELYMAVEKNIYGTAKETATEKDMDAMTDYLLQTASLVEKQPIEGLMKGTVEFR